MRLRFGKSWRSGRPADEPPLVIVDRIRSAMRLVALNAPARQCGFQPGQALAEARAILPSLEAIEYDSRADAVFLSEIAGWADRFTPLVGLDGDDGLMLDITGCAHLFGGEARLAEDVTSRLRQQGIAARAAIADTPGTAYAAARFGGPAVVPPGAEPKILKALPLLALRIPPAIVETLERLGIKRIGNLLDTPRQPLAARFGPALLQRLDQALGVEEEAISPARPMPELVAERRFAEPISLLSDISAVLRSLAVTLARRLDERGVGGRRFELSLYRVDGVVSRAEIGSGRPLRDPRLVGELFNERFAALGDELDAGFGFDLVRLSILATDDTKPAQIDLAGETDGEADLGRLIDRIGVRLGQASIVRLEAGDSHVPERSGKAIPAVADERPSPDWLPIAADEPIDRPLRLLARPEPVETLAEIPEGPPIRFRWRHASFKVARAEGPERIAAEWWREDGLTRDYFRVEDRFGQRFWLFREGLYGRDPALPRWFLQGLFA